MKFLDRAKIFLKAGNGGDGALSFRREKFVEYGGPDGGDGGKGGNIIFVGSNHLNTLIDYRYQQHFKAQRGENGGSRNKYGAFGKDLMLKVPVGTEILDESGEIVLADIIHENQTVVIAKGGTGGRGNNKFKSSVNQTPRRADNGIPGEELWVWLQLKLIADVGLVGLPNAGKSTFLSATTRARARIADYPFTTLIPQLGVVYLDSSEFVLADIPGLIAGAHEGRGLGDRFLAHVERCSALIHLVDAAQENPLKAYTTIRDELQMYDQKISEKKEIVVLNKIDAIPAEDLHELKAKFEENLDAEIFAISAISNDDRVAAVLREAIRIKAERQEEGLPVDHQENEEII